MRLALVPLALIFITTPSVATAKIRLCETLDQLRVEAARTATPQRIFILAEKPMVFGCRRHSDDQVQKAFCSAAFQATGIEFKDSYPWAVVSCLKEKGIQPYVETRNLYTGIYERNSTEPLPKIVRLSASWQSGEHIDITYIPTGDFGDDPEFKGYFGRWETVIWKP
jgi:hypothetical protein